MKAAAPECTASGASFVGLGRLQPLDRRQIGGEGDAQRQDRADEFADPGIVERLRCHQARGDRDARQVLGRQRRIAAERAADDLARLDGAVAGGERIGLADRDDGRALAEGSMQACPNFGDDAGIQHVDGEEHVDMAIGDGGGDVLGPERDDRHRFRQDLIL
ncbi:hypothetical protein QO058_17585 [Bosea vestrisii]|uniref:hypothetical protein n=1 Tax=Bosea vestrisii TaxID=151416 RepID=UPI0024DF4630|nr:hypothetical protein [Bosea vestrisii]WID94641.1 hypothetical protein QO058_17585 [Bosea vestrisii]